MSRSIARTPRMRAMLAGAVLAVLGATTALVGIPTASGRLSAGVTNNSNTVASNGLFTCTGAATALGASIAWPLDDPYTTVGQVAARDVSGNNRSGTYSLTGVAYRQSAAACPRDPTSGSVWAAQLDGLTGYEYYTIPFTLTNMFTESVWFNTTTTRGGRLIGFGSSATGPSVQYDRMTWMTNDGKLVFAVFPNAYKTITSTASYNDGQWHQLVASLGSAGMRLYVDGAQVAFDSTTTTAQTYDVNAMYLRVGYDNLATWTPAPTSYFFAGRVRFADYFPTQLSAAQVAVMYAAGR